MLSIIVEVAASGRWPSVEVRCREERQEVEDWRGKAQLFQALEKGPCIWGAGGDSQNTLERWGSGGRWFFSPRVGGIFRAIAFCFGSRIGAW